MKKLVKIITHPAFHGACALLSLMLFVLCSLWAVHNASLIGALVALIAVLAAHVHLNLWKTG